MSMILTLQKSLCIIFLIYITVILFTNGCGISGNTVRIIGGSDASNSWPWMTLIYNRFKNKNNTLSYKCGGTILNNRYILTAAHCFDEYNGEKFINAKVLFGKYNLSSIEPKEVQRYAKKVVIHEDYSARTHQNDIALVELDRDLDLKSNDSHLHPICIHKLKRPKDINNCYATGWGDITANGKVSSILQEVKLPIMNDNYCKLSRKYFNINIETMLCAGYAEGGKSTCIGDSGGPLMCQNENGVWFQYGITSFGGICGERGKPPVFTRVSYYKEWIEKIMKTKLY